MSMAACASCKLVATTTPLPAASPSALTTMGAPLFVDVGVCRLGIGEGGEFGGGNAVPRHEALGEVLGAFQLRGGLGGAEDAQAAGAEDIDDAGRQRRFRADHGQVDVFLLGEIGQGVDVGERQVFQLRLARRAGIAGRDQHLLQARRLGQAPGEGVFAAAGADDENLHGVHPNRLLLSVRHFSHNSMTLPKPLPPGT